MIISGKDGDYPADATDLPLVLTLAINTGEGQCGDYAFEDGCKTNGKLDKIVCK